MTLKECTKGELIQVIEYLNTHTNFNGKYWTERALNEIQYKRELAKLRRMDELIKISAEKRRRYAEILKPYSGMKFADVPMGVLRKADKLMKEAQAADKEWEKLNSMV